MLRGGERKRERECVCVKEREEETGRRGFKLN